MLKKTITYTDYNGVERTEDFYFNLNRAEITQMELSVDGGYSALIDRLTKSIDQKELMNIFKKIILDSYGEKTLDGKRFMKKDENGVPLSKKFEETEAFVILYMELAQDAEKAAQFINSVFPKKVLDKKETN